MKRLLTVCFLFLPAFVQAQTQINTTFPIRVTLRGLVQTFGDGLVIENQTLATAAVTSQFSPTIRLRGNFWNAANNSLDITANLEPVSAGLSRLHLRSSINGAAYTDMGSWYSNGSLSTVGSHCYLARSCWTSPSDGNVTWTNNAGTDFGLMQLGGTTLLFPAIKRSAALIKFRLADDSADAGLTASTGAFSGSVAAAGLSVSPGSSSIYFSSRSGFFSPSDGIIRLANNADNDFNRLQFGGTTSAFPSIKRNGTGLDFRFADDSAYSNLNANRLDVQTGFVAAGAGLASGFYGFSSGSFIYGPVDGQLLLQNNAANNFSRLMFGGTSASFPALRRTSASLDARLADDSNYANFSAQDIFSFGANGYRAAAGAFFFWNGRSALQSPSDGVITISNGAVTDFTRLQFGGTTASFPAIKRVTTALNFRLADDSGDAPITAGQGTFSGAVIGPNSAASVQLGVRGMVGANADGEFRVSNNGNTSSYTVQTKGTPTCATNCGTSPGLSGSDASFTLTMGAAGVPASGFIVTFGGTWPAAPQCTGSMALAGMVVGKLPLTFVTTTTTLTIVTNGTAPANSDKYHIRCSVGG